MAGIVEQHIWIVGEQEVYVCRTGAKVKGFGGGHQNRKGNIDQLGEKCQVARASN